MELPRKNEIIDFWGVYERIKEVNFKKIEGYCPFVGFYDLREFNLPKKVFSALWKVQEYLNHVRDNQEYFKKMDKNTWESAKNLSAEYQQRLFSYKKELRK